MYVFSNDSDDEYEVGDTEKLSRNKSVDDQGELETDLLGFANSEDPVIVIRRSKSVFYVRFGTRV